MIARMKSTGAGGAAKADSSEWDMFPFILSERRLQPGWLSRRAGERTRTPARAVTHQGSRRNAHDETDLDANPRNHRLRLRPRTDRAALPDAVGPPRGAPVGRDRTGDARRQHDD